MPEVMASTSTGASLFAPAVVLGVLEDLEIFLGGMISSFSSSVSSEALLLPSAAASSLLWLEVMVAGSAAVSRKWDGKGLAGCDCKVKQD